MSRSTLSIVLISSFALLSCQEETIPTSPERDVLLSPSVEASSELVYEIEQDGTTVQVEPLPGSESASSFYAYRSGGTGDSGDTGFEKSNTTRLFLYEAPDGTVSLFIINDQPFDDSGGAIALGLSGLPAVAEFVIKDDPPTQDPRDSYGPDRLTWAWNSLNSDGTVATGGFDDPFELTIKVESRTGITQWEFLSGDVASPSVASLDLSAPLTIRTAGSGTCTEEVEVARAQIQSDFGDRFTIALAEPTPLAAGTRVTDGIAAAETILVEEEACLVFVDPAPVFMYDHPVQYLLVSTRTKEVQTHRASGPPAIDGVSRWTTFDERINSPDLIVPEDPHARFPLKPPSDGGVIAAASPGPASLGNFSESGRFSANGRDPRDDSCRGQERLIAFVIASGRDGYIENSVWEVTELLESTYEFDHVMWLFSKDFKLLDRVGNSLSEEIASEQELFLGGLDPCDVVVVYIVSHGIEPPDGQSFSDGLHYDFEEAHKKEWNYAPSTQRPFFSLGSLLQDEFLYGDLIVVLDACYTESFYRHADSWNGNPESYRPNPGQTTEVFVGAREGKSSLGGSTVEDWFDGVTLSSVTGAAPSYQSKYTEGLTEYLEELRPEADRNNDGKVSGGEFRWALGQAHREMQGALLMSWQQPPRPMTFRGRPAHRRRSRRP